MTSTNARKSTNEISISQDPQEFWDSVARTRLDDKNCRDIDTLDKELEALATTLRLRREQRNREATAARLPVEILAIIFEFVRQESYGGAFFKRNLTGDERRLKNRSWVALSYVCKRWRQVALDLSSLWREINYALCGLDWAYEMLTRSKSAPLCVDIDVDLAAYHLDSPKRHSVMFIEWLLADAAGRLRTFAISGKDIDSHIQELTSGPELPVLEYLLIRNTDKEVHSWAPTTGLSLSLTAERMPNICTLGIFDVIPFDVPSITFDNLTFFEVALPEPPIVGPLYGYLLFDVLKCMPVLEYFYFANYPSEKPPIELQPPNLPETFKELTLKADHYSKKLLSFSRMFVHPTASRMFRFDRPIDHKLDPMIELLSSSDGTGRPLRSLHFEVVDRVGSAHIGIGAKFAPWPISSDGNTPIPGSDVTVIVKDIFVRTMMDACLREVVDLTYNNDCESSWLSRDYDSPAVCWRQLGQLAPNVQHLHVIGRTCRPLFRMLAGNDDLFPSMCSLSIIDSQRTLRDGRDELEGADELLAALETRRHRNMPIRDLKIPSRLVNGAWTVPLRALVDKFGGSRRGFY